MKHGVINFKEMSFEFKALIIRLYRIKYYNFPSYKIAQLLNMNATTLYYQEAVLKRKGMRTVPFFQETEEEVIGQIKKVYETVGRLRTGERS